MTQPHCPPDVAMRSYYLPRTIITILSFTSRVVKNGPIVNIVRVLTNRAKDDEETESYPLRYLEDFFGASKEVALSAEALA